MTTNDIDAIEARANTATPGPWEWHGHPFQNVTSDGLKTFYSVWVSGKPQLSARGDAVEPLIGKRETMIFIAAARQDVPELCAEVRELRAALERARALAETWAAMKYNGDLTAAVYHGCAEELAAALSSGGAA